MFFIYPYLFQSFTSNGSQGVKRPAVDDSDNPRKRQATVTPGNTATPSQMPRIEADALTPIDSIHTEAVLNFLLRLACQVSKANGVNCILYCINESYID